MDVKDLTTRPENYTRQKEISPAEKARQAWDDREGKLIIRLHNARRFILILVGIIVIMVGAIIYLATKSSVQPFVVMANPENGEVWHLGTVAASNNFEINDRMKKYFITNFVKKIRTIPLDPIVYTSSLREAVGFMTSGAADKLTGELENENISSKLGKETTTVKIVSFLPMEGGNTFQVRWTEDHYVIGTKEKETIPYSGIFSIQLIQQKDEKLLDVNPLGLYISEFSYSKDSVGSNSEKKSNARNSGVANPGGGTAATGASAPATNAQ